MNELIANKIADEIMLLDEVTKNAKSIDVIRKEARKKRLF
jgi:hypothetical protein